jgi:hypothetical protein
MFEIGSKWSLLPACLNVGGSARSSRSATSS